MADVLSANVGLVRQAGVVWQPTEVDAVLEMAMVGHHVRQLRNGQIDMASREGWRAVRTLLRCIGRAGDLMCVRLAPRGYRLSISEEILTAWTSAESRYSASILSVCLQGWQDFILNNQVFCLSEGTLRLSNELHGSWASIQRLLSDILRRSPTAVSRLEVTDMLEHFDLSWTAFELSFLMESQVAHRVAQNPLAYLEQACEHVANITCIYTRFDEPQDANMEDDVEYQEQHMLLIDVIVRINLVANPQCEGRAFQVQHLNQLEELIDECQFEYYDCRALNQNSTFVLAVDAVEAFHKLCLYFKQVHNCIGSLDPNLPNNRDLVQRLVRWEATWTSALEHLLDPLRRQSLETLVAGIRWVQSLSPQFVEMCEECSADMFLALPRLMWLFFLASPARLAPDVQRLLPHHFVQLRRADGGLGCTAGQELQALRLEYGRTLHTLSSAVACEPLEPGAVAAGAESARRDAATRLLARSAALGGGGDHVREFASALVSGIEGAQALEACKAFLQHLERWSLEIQRHHASSWNRFVGVVVRCLDNDVRVHCRAPEAFRA